MAGDCDDGNGDDCDDDSDDGDDCWKTFGTSIGTLYQDRYLMFGALEYHWMCLND